jgi:uncharacterized protein (UPF0212 family)
MSTYQVQAVVQNQDHDRIWTGTRQCPTFYLDSKVQGIVSAEHAERIAREIVDPFDVAHSVNITIVEI